MGDFKRKKIPYYEPIPEEKKEDDIREKIDKVVNGDKKPVKQTTTTTAPVSDKKPFKRTITTTTPVSDKIQFVNEIEKHPPENGFMEVKLEPGMYALDLRTYFQGLLADRPCTVNPMIVDRACRAAVIRRQAYTAERRLPSFPLVWVIFLIVGLVGVFFGLQMFGLI